MKETEVRRIILFISVAIILTLLFNELNLSDNIIKLLSFIPVEISKFLIGLLLNPVSFTIYLMILFDKYLWRIKFINNILYRVPKIFGKWVIDKSIESDFTHKVENPVFEIYQKNYRHISIYLKTAESNSKSVSAKIQNDEGKYILYYLYRNEPQLSKREKSPIHYGSVILNLDKTWKKMEGYYWTDRDTKNEICLIKKST